MSDPTEAIIREAIAIYKSGEPEPLIPTRYVIDLLDRIDSAKRDADRLYEALRESEPFMVTLMSTKAKDAMKQHEQLRSVGEKEPK